MTVMHSEEKLRLIEGGLHVDVRGAVLFVNGFDFAGVNRFYLVWSHQVRTPRGWVGHQREHKWFVAAQGTILLATVQPDRWDYPANNLPVERFVLCSMKPAVLSVPPGYATASMMLSADALLIVFSSGKIEDAHADDYRFPVETWSVVE
ncbi:MAG TPA: hypothetical protein PKN00_15385 [Sedimentisphaerales bacterium]|jgi:dTDP-4-dehydrorhamnose 3,5-epimerase|nr:hypothetical protein [Sedimentisphaerales bacterium]